MAKEKIIIENARLMFKNFSGKATDYNAEGDRNFCVVLNDEEAERYSAMGYNVKTRLPREGYEDDGPLHFLKVKVSMKFGDDRDAAVYRINGRTKTKLTARTIGSLDWDEIENVDLRIRPWRWEKGNRSGVSAFLDAMYVTVREDPLEQKYQMDDFPDPTDPDEIF